MTTEPLKIEIGLYQEEYFARFIKIRQGKRSLLVFNFNEADVEWARQIAEFLNGGPVEWPVPGVLDEEDED